MIGIQTNLSLLRLISCQLNKRRTSSTCEGNVNMYPKERFLFFPALLNPQPCPEGSCELGSVRPSVLPPSIWKFAWDWDWKVFLDAHVFLYMAGLDFFYKNLFAPKMSQKQGFLNLLEYLVITFFWIWSIKKVYDTCCILAHIPYFGKFWFLRYGSKCCSPIRLHYF